MNAHILDYQSNKIIFDWLSFTDKISSPFDIIELLGMQDCPFQELAGIRGIQGFQGRLYFNSISIHYDGIQGYVWVEMSGQGCRAFEELGHGNYKKIFDYILANPDDVNITRLDIAYDDFKGYLDLDKIAEDTDQGNFVSRFDDAEVIKSIKKSKIKKGLSVSHGSMRSNIFIRIYDKAVERNRSDEIPHWVRCEIQLRRNRAFEFIRLYMCENETIDHLYFIVLNHYLRYVEQSGNDSNKWRWELASHWLQFATSVTSESKSLFVTVGLDYNVLKLNHYVENHCAGFIYTYIKLNSVDKLLEVTDKFKAKLNPKYKLLLAEDKAYKEKISENECV